MDLSDKERVLKKFAAGRVVLVKLSVLHEAVETIATGKVATYDVPMVGRRHYPILRFADGHEQEVLQHQIKEIR